MSDLTTLVDRYIAMWNEHDAGRRRAIIAEAWTEDATYIDPLASVEGRDGIDTLVGAVQQQYPGHRFELTEGPDAHNDRARFTWTLVGDAGPVAVGIDFAILAPDGRLRDVTGFLEPVAQAA
jgi:hypothetical protein